jgi:aldose 1-epimerase
MSPQESILQALSIGQVPHPRRSLFSSHRRAEQLPPRGRTLALLRETDPTTDEHRRGGAAATASVSVHRWRGAAAVTLSSGDLTATFLPELNLLGTSLQLRGEDFVALPGGVAAYRRRRATGLPLLAPWANRLDARSYRVGDRTVHLRTLDLTTDDRELPIHGTMWREAWDVREVNTRGRTARLRAHCAYSRPDLLAAFPFPHELEVDIELGPGELSIATSIRPTTDRAVPVSFGYHPYLRLPGAGPRAGWRLVLPERTNVALSARGIPSGSRTEAAAEAAPIGERTFDDLFELHEDRSLGLETDDRRLEVRFDAGYRYAQVFAPPGARFVCLEPMTAPTNALRSGGFPMVEPGDSFTARFSIAPDPS